MALVPGSLQVDIFVTNIPKDTKPMTSDKSAPPPGDKPPRLSWTPVKNPLSSMEDVSVESDSHVPIYLVPSEERNRRDASSIDDDHNSLLMPNPHDGGPERYGDGGLKGRDYDYEMGLGASGSQFREDTSYDVLDDTHFNGDLDAEVNPAEESFSRRLRQEGAARRRLTRKRTTGLDQEKLWADLGEQVGSPTVIGTPNEPPVPIHGYESGERGHSQTLPVDATEGHKEGRRSSVPPYFQQHGETGKRSPNGPRDKRMDRMSMSSMNSAHSIRDQIMDVAAVQAMLPKTSKGARGEECALEFHDEELDDLLAMTEYAWPGRPMLDKLLREEVEMAKGAIAVACEFRLTPLFLLTF